MASAVAGALERNPSALFFLPMLSLTQAAALAPPAASAFSLLVLPGRGQLVIVAGGGRDLTWPSELIASHLLRASAGRLVQSLFHGGARGADPQPPDARALA
jgi:hypothetical protein